ncbi:hypothetical protein QE393_001105 [Pseudomonas sp. SORGH_AS 211]|nr:hypothetical protein [Pseudomonas sp. SORGH_AS_0211]
MRASSTMSRGDVGELEGHAQVAGAIQGFLVFGAHDARHHHPDYPGDVVAVLQGVFQFHIDALLDVHAKAGEVVQRQRQGNAVAPDHPLESGEGRILQRLIAVGGAGQAFQFGQAFASTTAIAIDLAVAQFLAIDDVVAMAAPGIEQHGALAGFGCEQLGGRGKALGADGDALLGVVDDVMGGWHG